MAEEMLADATPAPPNLSHDGNVPTERTGLFGLPSGKRRGLRFDKHGDMDIDYDIRKDLLVEEVWKEKATFGECFFDEIHIDRYGGFSEVENLWSPTRWVTALIILSTLVANLATITYMDFRALAHHDWHKPQAQEASDFLIINVVLEPLLCWTARKVTGQEKELQLGQTLPCIVELLGLLFLLGDLLLNMCMSRCSASEYRRWNASGRIFMSSLPELASYSGMRLLHFVTPTVLASDLLKWYHYTGDRWVKDKWGGFVAAQKWMKLFATRGLCFIIGVDVFLTKCRLNYHLCMVGALTWGKLWIMMLFLVQVLGIVQLKSVVRQRLFTFIFAGEDCILQPVESALQAVWLALVTREAYRHFSPKNWLKYMAVMMTFSNEDFQRLVLNEHSQEQESAAF